MTTTRSDGGRDSGSHGDGHQPPHPTETPHPPQVSDADLEGMSQEQLARLAANLDDVEVVHNADPWPIPGTRAEKRAERSVALWFLISAICGVAFLAAFLFWPHEYHAPGDPGYTVYALYTPLVGGLLGLAILTLGVAVIQYVKKFFPDEVSIQQRHDGPSDEVARRTVIAQLVQAGKDTGFARRRMILGTAGLATGIFGLGLGIAAVAPLVRNPWKGGPDAALWHSGWRAENETVYLRYDTGDPEEIVLVRPEDQEPGSMMTVFPFRNSERGNEEALLEGVRRADNPAMLIRLRPGTVFVPAPGHEGLTYGDYVAYSKVCTHLGCPASLYESQTNRILCPCHQSQFLAAEHARPVFGPAARPLPQLPITVNDEGYFVATGDFDGPVGPAFWEMGKI
jgi:ubiquinol-cytochrome c reductase iron-sulfur subunit